LEPKVLVEVPPVVREKALAAGAAEWLHARPQLIGSLEEEWGIVVGRSLPGGTEAFVAEASCEDGTAAVLKVMIPRGGGAAAHEITVLRLAGGRGCALLLRDDASRGALLLERLGSPLSELGLPPQRRQDILVAAARQVWRRAPDSGLPTGAEKARALAEFI
jgi:streptomycin 6-kinase